MREARRVKNQKRRRGEAREQNERMRTVRYGRTLSSQANTVALFTG